MTESTQAERDELRRGLEHSPDDALLRMVNDADRLARLTGAAWNPVSNKGDAKDAPQETVMVRRLNGEIEQAWGPSLLTDWDVVTHWARIRDVVLQPPA